ncbi:aldo/keto reductase [Streptomyces spectabilis]|uniref:Oxidoreductase n=1 Tax=Streptomyces spectabilis TaxID=68270 RepID=A0A516RA36_STRST|nr:aldo/keto reductase [Streptomyces spectabilis]QDQ12484.1 oxidoreductase [Streptomyces spectabilis]
MTTTSSGQRKEQDTFVIGGDLPVRRIGYGSMRLTAAPDPADGEPGAGHVWKPPTDRAAATAVLRKAVGLGVNLIDTADSYLLGGGEELIADALHPYADDLTIATKIGVVRPSATEWVPLGHPAYLRQQAELSLRRLRVERIDLLQLHRLDDAYPLADQIGALKQLRDEGKVLHIGLSEVSVEQLREASAITPIASVQNLYNLADRQHEAVVDHATEHGIAFLPFFPVAMGAHATAGGVVAEVAAELGATTAQTALAWLLRRSPVIVPIPGTTSVGHLEENVRALDVELSDEQFARLSGVAGVR